MPRPRRSEHTRESILEKGVELFSMQGYNGTGLKEILDAVKVPKGSFYNYFESKEDYALSVIEFYMDGLLGRFDKLIEQSTDPVDTIKTAYGMLIQELDAEGCQQGCLLGNLSMEISGCSEAARHVLQHSFSKWRKRFKGLVEKAQEAGRFRADISADELTDIYWCAWEGSILRMKIEGNTSPLSNTINLLMDKLFR